MSHRLLRALCLACIAVSALRAQAPDTPPPLDADTTAMALARQYLEGGADSRAALLEALQHMGWGVRNAKGDMLKAPPAGADTGLAMRDYELDELLWQPLNQPTVRLISVARALTVPFGHADPEEFAQDLLDAIRRSAESSQPQQRFWARFIIALGRVSPDGYDLAAPAPSPLIHPTEAESDKLLEQAGNDPFAFARAMMPRSIWPHDDPVLGPSQKPPPRDADAEEDPNARTTRRLAEITAALEQLNNQPAQGQATQERAARLAAELTTLTQYQLAAQMQKAAFAMARMDGGDEHTSGDNHSELLAEWRDQPLSLLQITLITRVLSADLRRLAQEETGSPRHARLAPFHPPLAAIGLRVAQGATFGQQVAGAAGDIWATGWGSYVDAVVEHHAPESKFGDRMAYANAAMAWVKTLLSIARQKITLEVKDAPLIRTKTRSAGERRTAHVKVEIDFPKSDVLKAIRAAGNLTSFDLQLPDGGPAEDAKIVWRLPEGSRGGSGPAVVQFAEGTGAPVTRTNSAGESSITIEGIPQKKELPATVRRHPRRAAVGVEVTIKVGNLTQDFNDAISIASGGPPPAGALSFIADMMLRTSLFFNQRKAFEVIDWKKPAWEGEFDITVKGSGSKYRKGEKGGPDIHYRWSMDRVMMGRLHTSEDEEAEEAEADYQDEGRHVLEVDGDSRMFRLNDSSSVSSPGGSSRYKADGPTQVPPPGASELQHLSRAKPGGTANLTIEQGSMTLELMPLFNADCFVSRSEQSRSRSRNQSGIENLILLNGVRPDTFTFTEPYDGSQEVIEGTKTITTHDGGNLPYVPGFDITITVKYRLWKNAP